MNEYFWYLLECDCCRNMAKMQDLIWIFNKSLCKLCWFSQTKMCICFLPLACYSYNNRKKYILLEIEIFTSNQIFCVGIHKSDSLQYYTLGRWVSLTRLMVQVLDRFKIKQWEKPCSFHIGTYCHWCLNIKAKLPAVGHFSLKQRVRTSTQVSPFEWVPEQLSRFLTDPTIATLLEHPGQ